MVKYDMEITVDKTVRMHAGKDRDTEKLPAVGNGRIQKVNNFEHQEFQIDVDRTAVNAATRNNYRAKLVRLRRILKCPHL